MKGDDHTAEIKWVKLTTDMFSNRKIKQIRHLPEGNNIVLIWVMLLTIAGRCNASGMIFLTENIPYTIESLAIELDFDQTVVKLALDVLQQFGMIICDENEFSICHWEEHQNVDKMDKIREYQKLYHRGYREKQKLIAEEIKSDRKVYDKVDGKPDVNVLEERNKNIEKRSKNIYEEFAKGDSALLDALKEFDSYRKMRKKPLTPKAKERLLKRLTTITDDPALWVKMLYQSIDQGWADIYEFRSEAQRTKYKSNMAGMGTVEDRQKAHEFKPTEF